jgi:hypothetical protein
MSSQQLHNKLQNLQEALSSLLEEVQPDSENKAPNQLKKIEDRILTRFTHSENFLVNQLEESVLAGSLMVTIFVMICLYIFYILIENLIRIKLNRLVCKCPTEGWDSVVNASKLILASAKAQTAQPVPPQSVPVSSVPVETA